MKRRAFAIMDVLVSLIVITIVGVIIGKYIVGIVDIDRQMNMNEKFEKIYLSLKRAVENKNFLKFSLITPRGVIASDVSDFSSISGTNLANFYNDNDEVIYVNYEKALYGCYSDTDCKSVDEGAEYAGGVTFTNKDLFSDINNFTVYHYSNEEKLKRQKKLLNIPDSVIKQYGDIPFLFVIQRYGFYKGVLYPYKIYSLIDVGPFLYKRLRVFFKNEKNNNDTTPVMKVMAYLFPVTENGVVIRKLIDWEKMKTNNFTLYKDFVSAFGGDPEKVFDENKKFMKIKIINTSDYVKNYLSHDINILYSLKKNVEDWAVIQARIAAYDSVNGNSMDKDYFITCTGNGCATTAGDIDKIKTLLPKLKDDAKIKNSIEDGNVSDDNIDELELDNGFFVCKKYATSNKHYKGYYCDDSDSDNIPYAISDEVCEDKISLSSDADSDDIIVKGAARIDVPTNVEGKSCLLSEGSRRLLGTANFFKNSFDIPIYFSNAKTVFIENGVSNLLNNSSTGVTTTENDKYEINSNVPLLDSLSSPPYNAVIFTIMPWFLGGIESGGFAYADYYVNNMGEEDFSGFGIIYYPIFAHVF